MNTLSTIWRWRGGHRDRTGRDTLFSLHHPLSSWVNSGVLLTLRLI